MPFWHISKDIKECTLYLYENKYIPANVCDILGVSEHSLYRWKHNNETFRSVIPPHNPIQGYPRILNADMTHDLVTLIEEASEAFLDEIQDWLALVHDVGISQLVLHENIWDYGLTYKMLWKAAAKRDDEATFTNPLLTSFTVDFVSACFNMECMPASVLRGTQGPICRHKKCHSKESTMRHCSVVLSSLAIWQRRLSHWISNGTSIRPIVIGSCFSSLTLPLHPQDFFSSCKIWNSISNVVGGAVSTWAKAFCGWPHSELHAGGSPDSTASCVASGSHELVVIDVVAMVGDSKGICDWISGVLELGGVTANGWPDNKKPNVNYNGMSIKSAVLTKNFNFTPCDRIFRLTSSRGAWNGYWRSVRRQCDIFICQGIGWRWRLIRWRWTTSRYSRKHYNNKVYYEISKGVWWNQEYGIWKLDETIYGWLQVCHSTFQLLLWPFFTKYIFWWNCQRFPKAL